MKLIIIKTCLWACAHMIIQKDTFEIAYTLYKTKQYKSAIEICDSQIKKLNPKDTLLEKFLVLRTNSHLESNRTNGAIQDYHILIDLKPEKVSYYIGLARIYDSVGHYEDGISVLKRGLKNNPKEIPILNNLSYYSAQINKYKDAINYADKGLKYAIEPMWKAALLNNRGYGYLSLGKYPEALDDINQAIQLDPNNSFAYCYRAIANIHLKRMETVCDDLKKAKNLGATTLTEDLIKVNCKN
jgi:tetratricopeptide (TPR) repeat protein